MKKTDSQVKQILRVLFTNGHGKSAEIINKYNKSNNLPSFGIMYPQLKILANNFESNNKIALQLLHKNTRDARIMGILLSNINTITINEALKMSEMLSTEELKNIFAHNTLSKFPYLLKLPLTYVNLFNINLTLKAIIQHYRYNSQTASYKNCKEILKLALEDKKTNKTDIKNFIEIVYKNAVSNRTSWITFLNNEANKNKNLYSLIQDAINDFKYLS